MTITQVPSARGPVTRLAGLALRRGARLLLGEPPPDDKPPADKPPAALSAVTAVLLLREFLGAGLPDLVQAGAAVLRRRQQSCGGWAEQAGGVPQVAASVQAYVVLRLAGDPPDAYHMARAAGWIRDAGGPALAGHQARTWLALIGLCPWQGLCQRQNPGRWQNPGQRQSPGRRQNPGRRQQLGLRLEPAGPDGWPRSRAASAVLPLAVIGSIRPARRSWLDISELQPPGMTGCRRSRKYRFRGPAPAGQAVLGMRARRPAGKAPLVLVGVRAAGVRRCAALIIASQDGDGSWGQAAQRSAFSVAALAIAGYPRRHPALAAGLAWLDQLAGADPAGEWPAAPGQGRGFCAPEAAGAAGADGAIGRCLSEGQMSRLGLVDTSVPDPGYDDDAGRSPGRRPLGRDHRLTAAAVRPPRRADPHSGGLHHR